MKSKLLFIIGFVALLLSPLFCLAQESKSLSEMADLEFDKGNYSNAVKLFNKVIAAKPYAVENYVKRAYSFYLLKNYKNAISDCQKALSFPELGVDYKCYILKLEGDSYFCLEDWEDAVGLYDKYLNYYFDHIAVNRLKAQAFFNMGKYGEAIKTSTFIINYHEPNKMPKDELKNFYAVIGLSYLYIDSLPLADRYCKLGENIDSSDFNIDRIRAELYFREENYLAATKIYNSILEADSSLFYIKYFRAQSYYYQKNYVEAIKDFNAVKKHYSKNDIFYFKRGNSYMNLKYYDNAIKDFSVCIKLKQNDPVYYNQISWCYFLMKKYKEALMYIEKSITLDPKYANAIDTRGCILYKQGNYSESLRDFNKAISIDSTINNSYYYRALVNLKINQKKKAYKDWELLLSQKDYHVPEGEKTIQDLIKENSL